MEGPEDQIKKGNFFASLNNDYKRTNKEKPHNRFFTPEEWFARYYKGQSDSELPENIFKKVSPQEIKELRQKYADRVVGEKNKEVDNQLDLFD